MQRSMLIIEEQEREDKKVVYSGEGNLENWKSKLIGDPKAASYIITSVVDSTTGVSFKQYIAHITYLYELSDPFSSIELPRESRSFLMGLLKESDSVSANEGDR